MTDQKNEYALFSGCVIQFQIPHIEKLARTIFDRLGINLVDLDFACCPSNGIRSVDMDLWSIIAARNIAVADERDLPIVSLCNGCTQSLREAQHLLKDKELKAEHNERLSRQGIEYKGKNRILHYMPLFEEHEDTIKSMIKKPLTGLTVASHTGCHLLRPFNIMDYDNPENPVKLDMFASLLGATPVDYSQKTLCCGSSIITHNKELSLSIMKEKLDALNAVAPDVLIVMCPSCYLHYDKNQLLMKRQYKVDYTIPVMHVLQLLGLSMGMSSDEVFLSMNRSMTPELIERLTEIMG